MKLIGSLTSPYVRKVRIVLAEKKLEYKLVLEDPWSDPPGLNEANPLGQVPCLILEGGDTLFDSRVIVEYVDTLSPVGRLIPEKGRERAEVRTWEALADGLLDAAVLARLETAWPGRADAERSAAWIDRQMGKVHASVLTLGRGLEDRNWFAGLHPTLADIAVGCALGYLDFRFPHITWRQEHPNLARLMQKLSLRPSFVNTLPPVPVPTP